MNSFVNCIIKNVILTYLFLLTSTSDIFFYLKKYWNYDTFRPLQQDIIESVLNKNDTLALLPTGGGKSICFQIPGLAIGGTCLVISPLIALMNDQVQNLKKRGISAVAITSSMNAKEIDIALNNAALGHVQFLYVSPERIEGKTFQERLSYLPISLIVVDEAHCISQWGYDFRPSYLKIAEIRAYFPEVNVIAVTASATKDVVSDIQEKLGFKKPNVFRQSFERKNIRYVVQLEENKYSRMMKIIKNIGGSGIIYVRNRKKTEEISRWLNQQHITSSFYHAGLTPHDRELIQKNWINNKTQVMVATNAFGMGIDKPDVRFVVHIDLPDSLEAYFQEAGRGGRDEKTAYAVLLYDKGDVSALHEYFEKQTPSNEEIKQSYQAICNFYQVPVESGEGLAIDFDINEISRNYNIKPIVLYNSILALEKEGYFSYNDTNGFEPAKLMLVMNKEEIYNFQLKFPRYDLLLKTILRSYGGVFEQYCYINENQLAFRAKFPEAEVKAMLNNLHTQGVISYIPQSILPKLIFLRNRVNVKFTPLQLINYPILKEKAKQRINSVVNYVHTTTTCRNRLLLTYFDENEHHDCGYCDVCVENQKHYLEKEEQIKYDIKIAIQQKPYSLQEITEKFNAINSLRFHQIINRMIDDDEIEWNQHQLLSIKK